MIYVGWSSFFPLKALPLKLYSGAGVKNASLALHILNRKDLQKEVVHL